MECVGVCGVCKSVRVCESVCESVEESVGGC